MVIFVPLIITITPAVPTPSDTNVPIPTGMASYGIIAVL
jgi:hypothetical protein